jgi:ATP-dependent exoDNAse (exonuclease V) alpha subunit
MPLNSPTDLNPEKQNALEMLKKFIKGTQEQVFVLSGYAGTGKTTLVKFFAGWCRDNDIPISLLASTGRAAKVLREKTGFSTETVHRLIYSIDTSELDESSKTQRITFRLNSNASSEKRVYLIDESSMISDKPLAEKSLTLFGTGSLLDDLFHYVGDRKVIFVGDSAQLPPVNANFSPALSLPYLIKKFNIKGTAVNLTQVMRYGEQRGIFENAARLLNVIKSENFTGRLAINASSHNNIKVFALDSLMLQDYVKTFKKYSYEGCILIALSNRLVNTLNRQIRALLFGPNAKAIMPGEVLMAQQNNYMLGITNGEHLEIARQTGAIERKAGIDFMPVEIYVSAPDGRRVVKAMLMKDFLDMDQARLDNEAEFRLTSDFIYRMRQQGIHPKRNKEDFLSSLLSDPYMNAIRARYGYAVTCHKAQGGEWENVYIILEKGLWHPGDVSLKFKWSYTALTRSTTNLFFLENWAIN